MKQRPFLARASLLDLVWLGMPVVDSEGKLIGSVKLVRTGDPAAAAVADGGPFAEENLNEAFARALTQGEPRVGPAQACRLIREGFLEVAGAGLMDHDRYVAADQIAGVDEDVVQLRVRADQVVVERQHWI
ncbi:PRC-barrel domain-containing protein [Kribbella sp. CA-253562]|uniref:PRC-barrel domain-containing protein n=1 Tax=Kribbella sp. CA-253562 TaxID=3239942 RepID=UPI003D8DA30E